MNLKLLLLVQQHLVVNFWTELKDFRCLKISNQFQILVPAFLLLLDLVLECNLTIFANHPNLQNALKLISQS